MPPSLLYEVRDGVAFVTFNRPEQMNASSVEMRERLAACTETIERDPDVRAVLIRGAGEHFMAGGDLTDMRERIAGALDDHRASAEARASAIHLAILRLCRTPKPVVAAVQGAVAGMGVSIALAADLLVATDDAYFLMAFNRVGLPGDCGITYHLPRIVGERRALELMLLGDRLAATRAHDLGIVSEIVARPDLNARAEAIARRLARGATIGLGLTKTLIRTSFSHSLEHQLAAEARAAAAAVGTDDHVEGVLTLLERREPRFKGR